MNKTLIIFFFLVLFATIIGSFSSCYYDNEEYLYSTGGACTDTTYSYNGRVKALVDQNCASSNCHSGASPSGSIGLENYADVKNNVENGNFLCSINWNSGCSQMPKNTSKLNKCSISAIEKWKEKGYPEN